MRCNSICLMVACCSFLFRKWLVPFYISSTDSMPDSLSRWPRVPHAGSRIEWSGPFSRMDTVHSHSRPAHARGEMAAKTECAKAQLQWRDQSDCAEPRREILRQ